MIPPTPENIRAALSFLSPDLPRDEWSRIAMAVKDGLNGEGFELFDEWSQGGHSYNATDCRDTWKSVRAGGGVTVATLYALAKEAGWRPNGEAHQETEAERLERERRRKAWEEQETKDQAKQARQAAQKAKKLFIAATAARSDHPYLSRKGVNPVSTLQEIPADRAAEILGYVPKSDGEPLAGRLLLVPVKAGGKLVTVEMIDEAGRKTAIAGGPKAGGYWAAQPLPEGNGAGLTLAIGEGVATVLSVHQGTGHPVIAALSAGNLSKVAKAMRDRYPAARLVILADLGNGQAKAEQAARDVGAALAVPRFRQGSAGTDWNDLAALSGLDVVREQVAAAITPAPATDTPAAKTYTLLTFDDLAALPPMKWKVKGLLPDNGIAAIYGPSGSGKSFLSLDLAGAIGAGREWFGHRVNPAPVVYLCLEGEGGLRNRVAAYRTQHGGDALANVRFIVESFDMLNGDPAALIRTVQAAGLESPVVFIDTLNRAAPGADENSGLDMGRIITAAKAIQSALGGLVVLVHHTGKDAGKGLRGHSSLHAALDAAISVDRGEFGRSWTASKVKDGVDGGKYPFTLKGYVLGEDEDGDRVTSCAVVPEGQEDGTSEQRRSPLGKNGAKALDVLHDLYEQHRSNLLTSGKNPEDARVLLADWCDLLRDVCGMPRNRAYDAREEVRRKGYVAFEGGYVYLIPDGNK